MFSNLSDWLSRFLKMQSAARVVMEAVVVFVPQGSSAFWERTHTLSRRRTLCRDMPAGPPNFWEALSKECERKEPCSAENSVPRTLVGHFGAGRYGPAPLGREGARMHA